MQNLSEYYLIMEKVIDLPSPKRNLIVEIYRDMLHFHRDKSYDHAISYFNTLEMGGYIANRTTIERDKKLGDIVNE